MSVDRAELASTSHPCIAGPVTVETDCCLLSEGRVTGAGAVISEVSNNMPSISMTSAGCCGAC